MTALQTTRTTKPVLHTDLTPCDRPQIVQLLGPLFRNLESFRKFTKGPPDSEEEEQGKREKQEWMAIFVRPLLDEPAWAIEQAVQRFLDGLVERHPSRYGKTPHSDEFAREVRRLTSWAREREEKRRVADKRRKAAQERANEPSLSEEGRRKMDEWAASRKAKRPPSDDLPKHHPLQGPSPAARVAAETQGRSAAREASE